MQNTDEILTRMSDEDDTAYRNYAKALLEMVRGRSQGTLVMHQSFILNNCPGSDIRDNGHGRFVFQAFLMMLLAAHYNEEKGE